MMEPLPEEGCSQLGRPERDGSPDRQPAEDLGQLDLVATGAPECHSSPTLSARDHVTGRPLVFAGPPQAIRSRGALEFWSPSLLKGEATAMSSEDVGESTGTTPPAPSSLSSSSFLGLPTPESPGGYFDVVDVPKLRHSVPELTEKRARRVRGKAGDLVEPLWQPTDSEMFVLIGSQKTRQVGLVSVTALSNVDPHCNVDMFDDEHRKMEADNGVHKAPPFLSLDYDARWKDFLNALSPESYSTADGHFACISGLGRRITLVKDLLLLCRATTRFMWCAWKLAPCCELDNMASIAEGRILAADNADILVFLMGCSVLVNLHHQQTFSELQASDEFKALHLSLCSYAVTGLPQNLGTLLLQNSTLRDDFLKSLPTPGMAVKSVIKRLSRSCCIENLHFLFSLIVLDGSLKPAAQKQPSKLCWHDVANHMVFHDGIIMPVAKILIHALAQEFSANAFDGFDNSLVPYLLSKALSDTRPLAFVAADAEAVWKVIQGLEFDSHVEEIVQCVKRLLQSYPEICELALSCAPYYFPPPFLRKVWRLGDQPLSSETLQRRYNFLLVNDHLERKRALQSTAFVARGVFFELAREAGDGAVDLPVFLAEAILQEGSADEVSLHSCVALAMLTDGPGVPGRMEGRQATSLANLVDVLNTCGHGSWLGENLLSVVLSIHRMLGCDPLATLRALSESAFLRQSVHEGDSQLVASKCLTITCPGISGANNGHPALLNHVTHAMSIVKFLRGVEAPYQASGGSAIGVFWAMYCASLVESSRQLQPSELMAMLQQDDMAIPLTMFAQVQQEDDQPSLSLEGCLASTLLDIFWVNDLEELNRSPDTLITLLATAAKAYNHCASLNAGIPANLRSFPRRVRPYRDLAARLSPGRNDYTRWELQFYSEHLAKLNQILHALQEPAVPALQSWSEVDGQCRRLKLLLGWLGEQHLQGAIQLKQELVAGIESPDTKFHQLQAVLERADKEFASRLDKPVAGVDGSCPGHQYIAEVVAANTAIASLACSFKPVALEEWPGHVQYVLQTLCSRIDVLLSGRTEYGYLLRLFESDTAWLESTGRLELNSITDTLGSSAVHGSNQEGIARLKRLLVLLRWKEHGLKGILSALDKSPHLSDSERSLWQHEQDKLMPSSDEQLDTVDQNSSTLYKLIAGFQPCHLKFFILVSEGTLDGLFEFFRGVSEGNNDASNLQQQQSAFINTHLKGDPHHRQLMKILLAAQPVMAPFFSFPKEGSGLLSSFKTNSFDPSTVQAAAENLGPIMLLLRSVTESSFDEAERTLVSMAGARRTTLQICKGDGGKCFFTCGYSEAVGFTDLGMDKVRQLQLCLPYFYHLEHTKRHAIKLSAGLAQAEKLFKVVILLDGNGHISYLESIKNLVYFLDAGQLQQHTSIADTALSEWKAKLNEARKRCSLLNVFSNRDVGAMMEALSNLLSSRGQLQSHKDMEWMVALLALILPCVPGALPGIASKLQLPEFARAVWRVLNVIPFDPIESLISLFNNELFPSLLKTSKLPSADAGVIQTLCFLDDYESPLLHTAALAAVLHRYFAKGPVCRSQFLLCSAETSKEDLARFSVIVHHSFSSTFAVCGIDLLKASCLSELIDMQQRLGDDHDTSASVIYLSYSREFAESWPASKCVSSDILKPVTGGELKECYLKSGSPCRQLFNVGLVAVRGPPGVGKTAYINQFISVIKTNPLVIDLTDKKDFSVINKALLKECLQKKPGTPQRSVVLRIPTNANLQDVNQAFFELIWCGGLLIDGVTESAFSLELRPSQMSEWFVEVPSYSDAVATEGQVVDVEKHLPFLWVAAADQPVNFMFRELTLEEGHREFGSVLHRFFSDKLGTKLDGSVDSIVNDKVCLLLFEMLGKHYHVEDVGWMRVRLIVTYVQEKWSILRKSGLQDKAKVYPDLPWEVMNQLIHEAIYLSQPNLQFVFHQCEQSLLLHDCFSLVGSPTAQEVHKQVPELRSRSPVHGTRQWSYIRFQTRSCQLEALSQAFHIDAGDIARLCQEKCFVLTPDFTFKLLLIHDRRLLRKPLVLQGETGVGKTYLLKMYTHLISYATEYSPSLSTASRVGPRLLELLKTIIFVDFWSELSTEGRRYFPRAGSSLGDSAVLLGCVFGEDTMWDDISADQIEECWKKFLSLVSVDSQHSAKKRMQKQIKTWHNELSILAPLPTDAEALLDPSLNLSEEDSLLLLRGWLAARTNSLFMKKLVHPGMTRNELDKFVQDSQALAEKMSEHVIVVFFDEINTSPMINTFKEIMINSTLGGEPIKFEDRMFFVAAVNPCRKDRWNVNYFGVSPEQEEENLDLWEDELGLEYKVVELPKVMECCKWIYHSLQEDSELEDYTTDKINFLKGSPELQLLACSTEFSHQVLEVLSKFLLHAYRYCYKLVSRSFVSQRDVQRVFNLIPHFWNVEVNLHSGERIDANILLRKCILLSIALAFYVRLPLRPSPKFPDICRDHFDRYVTSEVMRSCPTAKFDGSCLKNVLEQAVDEFVTREHFIIPDGVALTTALKENIYCIVACIQRRIPLGIIGEPGSSKTLSYQIVCQNLHGSISSKLFCTQFSAVDSFFCLCSPDTTTSQITGVFSDAIDRQDAYNDRQKQNPEKGILPAPRPTVFIDEAGLPSIRHNRMVMKVLHPYLDEPEVAFVALSNHWFDAANTNRMLTVFRSHPEKPDLMTLACGCTGTGRDRRSAAIRTFLEGVCEGYSRVMEKYHKWYHLRDLIALFRYFRRHQLKTGDTEIRCDEEVLLCGLQENFGGLSERDCKTVVNIFFEEVHRKLPAFSDCLDESQWLNPVEVLLNLNHQHQKKTEPNFYVNTSTLAPRFQLLIDDYGCDYNIVDLLCHVGVVSWDCNKTRIFQLSGLSSGSDQLQCANVLANIRQSLNQPVTVVVVNSPELHGYLYELLNQSYQTVTVDGKRCAYTNIAMNDGTFPSPVHPLFRCIVIMDRTSVRRERTRFLSRFSKFSCQPALIRQYVCKRAAFPEILQDILTSCSTFITTIASHFFYGSGLETSLSDTLDLLLLKQLHLGINCEYELRDETASGTVRNIISHFFRLMPLESFLTAGRMLQPQEQYQEMYLNCRRDSFVLSSILRTAIQRTRGRSVRDLEKMFLFTKSPAFVVHRLTMDDSWTSRKTCFGEDLVETVEVRDCKQFQQFSDLQRTVEDFFAGPRKCIVICFDVSEPLQRAAVGPVKRLLDQLGTSGSALSIAQASDSKVAVLLIHSLLLYRPVNGIHGAFLNGWTSCYTTVDSLAYFSPVTVEEFISATHFNHHGSESKLDRSSLCQRIQGHVAKHSQPLAMDFCRRLDSSWNINPVKLDGVQEIYKAAFYPVSKDQPAIAAERIAAMHTIITTLPVHTWLGDSILTWVIKSGAEWVDSCAAGIMQGRERSGIVDLLSMKLDEVLNFHLQILLRKVLEKSNFIKLLPHIESNEECLVSKLLRLVEAPSTNTGCYERSDAGTPCQLSSPFFDEFMLRVMGCSPESEEYSHFRMHLCFTKDEVLFPLLKEELFMKQCLPDLLSYSLQWHDSRPAMFSVAVKYVTLGFDAISMDVKHGKDVLSHLLSLANIPTERNVLLALLNATRALHDLLGQGQLLSSLSALSGSLNQPDLLQHMAVNMVKWLWSRLMDIVSEPTAGAVVHEDHSALMKWQQVFRQVCQHWSFGVELLQHQAPTTLLNGAVQFAVRSFGSKVKLMTIADIVLCSLTVTDVGGVVEFLRLYLLKDLGLGYALAAKSDLPMDTALSQLLLLSGQRHSSEGVQLRYMCMRWLHRRLNAKQFRQLNSIEHDGELSLLLRFISATHGGMPGAARPDSTHIPSVPARLCAQILFQLEAHFFERSGLGRPSVRRTIEALVDKTFALDQVGAACLNLKVSLTSMPATYTSQVVPLAETFLELACMWQRQDSARLAPDVDRLEFHVNRACESGMVRKELGHGPLDTVASFTAQIWKTAMVHIAIEAATCRMLDLCNDFTAGQVLNRDINAIYESIKKLHVHLKRDTGNAWHQYWLWKVLRAVETRTLHQLVEKLSSAMPWAAELERYCCLLAPLEHGSCNRTTTPGKSVLFVPPADDPKVGEAYNALRNSLRGHLSGSPTSVICAWNSAARFDPGIKEACVLWAAYYDYILPDNGGAIGGLPSQLECSPLLKHALVLLLSKDRPLTEFQHRVTACAADDCMLQDVFMSTLTTILILGSSHHLYTCATNPEQLQHTFLFAALSNRAVKVAGGDCHEQMSSKFFDCRDAGLMEPLELEFVPQLSYLGNLAGAVLASVALCWNAVLFLQSSAACSEPRQWSCGGGTEAASHGETRVTSVRRLLDRIQQLMRLLSKADVCMSKFSSKPFLLGTLQCMLVAHHTAEFAFQKSYLSSDTRTTAEHQFQRLVVQPALESHCRELHTMLHEDIDPILAKLHWQQLSNHHVVSRNIWFLAQHSRRRILTVVLARLPRLRLVKYVFSILKLYLQLHDQLGGKLSCASVMVDCLTVQDAIDRHGNDSDLQSTFDQAVNDFQKIAAACAGDLQVEGQNLVFDKHCQLRHVLNRPVNGANLSVLSHAINLVLSWQLEVCDVCRSAQEEDGYWSVYTYPGLMESIQEFILPDEIVSKQGAGLLHLDGRDLENLFLIHCQRVQDPYWSLKPDLESLEKNLVAHNLSTLKRIDWLAFDKSFQFRFRDDARMTHPEFKATPQNNSPLLVQYTGITKALGNMSHVAIVQALSDLRRLLYNMKWHHQPADSKYEQASLNDYIQHKLDTEGIDYSHLRPFGAVVNVDGVLTLADYLDRWLQGQEPSLSHIPTFLSQQIMPETKGILAEKLSSCFEQSNDWESAVAMLEHTVAVLRSLLPTAEEAPQQRIAEVLAKNKRELPDPNLKLFEEIPASIRGYHFKALISFLLSFLDEKKSKRAQEELLSMDPVDPCGFHQSTASSSAAPERRITVRISFYPPQVEPQVVDALVSELVLEVVRRTLTEHGVAQSITITCCSVGSTFLPPGSDATVAGILPSDQDDAVAVQVVLAGALQAVA